MNFPLSSLHSRKHRQWEPKGVARKQGPSTPVALGTSAHLDQSTSSGDVIAACSGPRIYMTQSVTINSEQEPPLRFAIDLLGPIMIPL